MSIRSLLIATVLPLGMSSAAFSSDTGCATAPEPVVHLHYVSRYAQDDANRDTIDPEREAEAEAALAPLDDFIVTLATDVDRMYSGPVKARPETAACILDRLAQWADADALSDLGSKTVRLTIGSRYAAFALIAWQTLPYAHDHPARSRITAWLTRRMQEQVVFWAEAPSGARQGNLRAWAGLAAAALSVQTGNAMLADWAEDAVSEVMCTANEDGSLPQEMSRGRLALHYQLHAIAPLVTAAALLERQSKPVSKACDGALHRIVGFAIDDLGDGARTRDITGQEQSLFDGTSRVEPFQLAWIEPYLVLTRNEDLAVMARLLGPLGYSKLGGNQTALWGH